MIEKAKVCDEQATADRNSHQSEVREFFSRRRQVRQDAIFLGQSRHNVHGWQHALENILTKLEAGGGGR